MTSSLTFSLSALFNDQFHCIGITMGTLPLPDGLSSDQHLIHIALCLEPIICDHNFMQYPPSRLALAALACDLKLIGCNWLDTVLALQALAKVGCVCVCVCVCVRVGGLAKVGCVCMCVGGGLTKGWLCVV